MESSRFDSLTRMITSRRAVSGALAGTVVGLLGLAQVREVSAARCPKGKKRCGEKCIPKRGCCATNQCRPKSSGKVCKRGRCVCPAGMKRCGKRCLLRPAACPPKPDAFCAPTGGEGFIGGDTRIAQTFTEPNGGRLIAAKLWIRTPTVAASGTYELRLQTVDPATGVPQQTTLGVTLRSSDDVSNTELVPVRFDFPVPYQLQPGRRYALALSLVNSTSGWFMDLRNSDFCPGTELFVASASSGFSKLPGFGAAFQTIVKA
jgi:hypothetical protein